jgi:hypothetical protein
MEYQHAKAIANLYLKVNDYDPAIEILEYYRKNSLLKVMKESNIYELAVLHAVKGDTVKSITFLKELQELKLSRGETVYNVKREIQRDKHFDSIRSTPEFQEFMRESKEVEK